MRGTLMEDARLLMELDHVVMRGESKAFIANSLKLWYLEKGGWSEKQKLFVQSIIAGAKRKKRIDKKQKYHLYAITNGEEVKLGVSSDIKRLIKTLQRGHENMLACMWKYYVGCKEEDAAKMEKKLHRYCDEFRVRGDWFDTGCMDKVEKFRKQDGYKKNINNIHSSKVA